MRDQPASIGDSSVLRRRIQLVGWGFADQVLSSGTNLALTIVAARLLGPSGLGVIVVGFSVYTLGLSLQHGLLSEPFVVSTSATGQRLDSTRPALTVTGLIAAGVTAIVAGAALLVPGTVGKGLALFVPWIAGALVQDFCRSALFRDGRGRAAALNDATWLVVMAASYPLATRLATDWAIVGWWGAGASVGAILGLVQLRVGPIGIRVAWRWWRDEPWRLGRWLVGQELAYAVGSQTSVLVIGTILGPAALGGLRAVQTVFAPLSLLTPAVALPGLPMLVRIVSLSTSSARRVAAWLSFTLAILTLGYLLVAGLGGTALLRKVFGDDFATYAFLIVPIGVQQIALAIHEGFNLLLKAMQRGRAIFVIRVTTTVLGLTLVTVSSLLGSLRLVAWSTVVARSTAMLLTTGIALRDSAANPDRRTERPRQILN